MKQSKDIKGATPEKAGLLWRELSLAGKAETGPVVPRLRVWCCARRDCVRTPLGRDPWLESTVAHRQRDVESNRRRVVAAAVVVAALWGEGSWPGWGHKEREREREREREFTEIPTMYQAPLAAGAKQTGRVVGPPPCKRESPTKTRESPPVPWSSSQVPLKAAAAAAVVATPPGLLCLWRRYLTNYLVDPASSHMLVSKIKPCMCQYTPILRQNREWLIKSVMIH